MCKQQRAGDLPEPAVEQLGKAGALLQCKLESGKSPLRRDAEQKKAEVSMKCWRGWMWGRKCNCFVHVHCGWQSLQLFFKV